MVNWRHLRPGSGAPRGVALINALLIVAALSAVTVSLLQRNEASNTRLIELQRAGQAELYLDAVTVQLNEVVGPAQRGPDGETNIVELDQPWARPARGIVIGNGRAAWQVEDLQGRFNLAWLTRNFEAATSDGDGDEGPQTDLNAMVRDAFREIALEVGLARGQVRRLEQALIPDLGQRVTAYGRGTRPPPLPPSALDELLLVDGIDGEALTLLQPYFAAVSDDATGLNLNTVKAEVLAALLGDSSVESLASRLDSARPFATTDEAMRWVETRTDEDGKALLEALDAGVDSNWFEARIELQLDTLVLTRRVVMQRADAVRCCRIQSVLSEYP